MTRSKRYQSVSRLTTGTLKLKPEEVPGSFHDQIVVDRNQFERYGPATEARSKFKADHSAAYEASACRFADEPLFLSGEHRPIRLPSIPDVPIIGLRLEMRK